MIDIPAFFLTEAVFCTDMNASDFEVEIDFMIERNNAVSNFYDQLIEGSLTKGSMDVFGDILNHYWIDPYAWLNSVEKRLLI